MNTRKSVTINNGIFTKLSAVRFLLIIFFLIAVFFPLLRMLVTMADTNVVSVMTSDRFRGAFVNSFQISIVAAVISVSLSMLLAWCIVRIGIRLRNVWTVLFTLPMLIPSISHGMGLVVLLGSNGILTRMLGLKGDIYGFWGVVTGSVMYSFPVAFLMISDILKYEDSTPYEAADVLGISKFRQFTAITLPYLRKPMIAVFFSVFTLVITDYGVPLMVGNTSTTTLPIMMYQDVIEGLNFGKGSVIGLVLLLPALIAFMIDLLNKDRGNLSYLTKPFAHGRNKLKSCFAYLFCVLVGIAVLLPILSFAVLTFVQKYPVDFTLSFRHIIRALDMNVITYLLNSLLIAVLVAFFGVITSCIVAYMTARTSSKTSKLLHLISIASLAVPGLVLGLSYALFFKGSFIYNTLAILVLVNSIHFFASPYLMMYNSFGKLNENLEIVGSTLGIGRFRIVLDVLIPQAKITMIEMFSYFFVNSMITISAVSFLAAYNTKPVALMIPNFEKTMLLESAAFVSLLILAVNLLIRGAASIYSKRAGRKA